MSLEQRISQGIGAVSLLVLLILRMSNAIHGISMDVAVAIFVAVSIGGFVASLCFLRRDEKLRKREASTRQS